MYVEVRFYVFAGLLFLLFGEIAAIAGIIGMFLVAAAMLPLQPILSGSSLHLLEIYRGWTSAEHFGWFAAGALYYRFFRSRSRQLFVAATVVAFIAALTINKGPLAFSPQTCGMALLVLAFFAAAVQGSLFRSLLRSRFLLFFGYISYPLYLVHENIMVQLTIKLGKFATGIPAGLLPVLPIFAVVFMGWLIARYGEPMLVSLIRPVYGSVRVRLGIDRPARKIAKPAASPLPGTGT